MIPICVVLTWKGKFLLWADGLQEPVVVSQQSVSLPTLWAGGRRSVPGEPRSAPHWLSPSPSPTWLSGCCRTWSSPARPRTRRWRTSERDNKNRPDTRGILLTLWTEISPHLLRIVLQCEEVSVDKHQPADHPQHDQPVTEAGFVEVENLIKNERNYIKQREAW